MTKISISKKVGTLDSDVYQGDFTTPEYQETAAVSEKPFEMNRGLGKSFGFNQLEGEAETLSGWA